MSDVQDARTRCNELLKLAAGTQNLGERSRLLSEAVYWNEQAQQAERARRNADRDAVIPFLKTSTDPEAT